MTAFGAGPVGNGQSRGVYLIARCFVSIILPLSARLFITASSTPVVSSVRSTGHGACPGCKDPTLQRHRMKRLLRELERAHPGLKRSLLGALGRVDLGSLPIPTRKGARPGDRLPILDRVAALALAGAPGAGNGAR